MENIIRRSVFPFEVEVEEDYETPGKKLVKDIYITELGYVMVSVFNEEKKVTVNYICGELKDLLPQKMKIKGLEDRQSALPYPST